MKKLNESVINNQDGFWAGVATGAGLDNAAKAINDYNDTAIPKSSTPSEKIPNKSKQVKVKMTSPALAHKNPKFIMVAPEKVDAYEKWGYSIYYPETVGGVPWDKQPLEEKWYDSAVGMAKGLAGKANAPGAYGGTDWGISGANIAKQNAKESGLIADAWARAVPSMILADPAIGDNVTKYTKALEKWLTHYFKDNTLKFPKMKSSQATTANPNAIPTRADVMDFITATVAKRQVAKFNTKYDQPEKKRTVARDTLSEPVVPQQSAPQTVQPEPLPLPITAKTLMPLATDIEASLRANTISNRDLQQFVRALNKIVP